MSVKLRFIATVLSAVCHLINGARVIFTETPTSVIVEEGTQAQFNCSGRSANPSKEPIYFWKFNGEYISEADNYTFTSGSRSLVIENVIGKQHEGKYQCVAFVPEYGAIISLPAYLKTSFLTVSTSYTSRYDVETSSSLLLRAPTISGSPEPQFNWVFKDTNGRFTMVDSSDTYVTKNGDLLIPNTPKKYDTVFRLYVNHPMQKSGRFVARIFVTVTGEPVNCTDNTIIFPVRESEKTVNEGESLEIECIGVATRCSLNRETYWELRSGSTTTRLPARHFVKSTTLSDKGTYVCHVSIGNQTNGYSVFITIKAKPVIYLPTPNGIDITSAHDLSVGFAQPVSGYDWYTNGEIVTGSTQLLQKTPQNKLKFSHLSKSLSSIYQIFYNNGDLTTTQDIDVFVSAANDFGWKVSGLSGSIVFNPETSHSSVTHSSWLIQVPSVQTVYVTIGNPPKCADDGTTQLHVYQGSAANGRSIKSICRGNTFTPVVDIMKGPFITLVLVTRNLTACAFDVHFDVNWPVTTPPPMTTTTTTTKEATTTTTTGTTTRETTPTTTSTARATSTQAKTTAPADKFVEKEVAAMPIGGIVGGIVGATVLIILVIIGLFCYRQRRDEKKVQANTFNSTDVQKGGPSHLEPRNTFLTRRPGNDQTLPSFSLQPRPGGLMPDLIPEYDAVAEYFESGDLGEWHDDAGNATYERVEDVLQRADFGNLAYQPAKAPKNVIGRRIPSGPGGQSPQIIRTDITQRPRDPMLLQQQKHLNDDMYDSVDDNNDYLAPVPNRPRLVSMEGRPLPPPSESTPVYLTVEKDASLQGNAVYEMPCDANGEVDKAVQQVERRKPESAYAALEDEPITRKDNAYQPLTLSRKSPKEIESVGMTDELPQDESIKTAIDDDKSSVGGDYCDPYEPAVPSNSTDENRNERQPLDDHVPRNETHKTLEAQASGCYEPLDDPKNDMETYQALTLPRPNDDDGYYTPI